jgi:hypothetical protein
LKGHARPRGWSLFWNPVVAIGRSPRQVARPESPQKQAKSLAASCHRLPFDVSMAPRDWTPLAGPRRPDPHRASRLGQCHPARCGGGSRLGERASWDSSLPGIGWIDHCTSNQASKPVPAQEDRAQSVLTCDWPNRTAPGAVLFSGLGDNRPAWLRAFIELEVRRYESHGHRCDRRCLRRAVSVGATCAPPLDLAPKRR